MANNQDRVQCNLRDVMELRQERDQLRAELAAAKNLLARIHRDGGHHTGAVGFAQSVADADSKVSEWLLAADERDQLAAHVERLVAILKAAEEEIPDTYDTLGPGGYEDVQQVANPTAQLIRAALAATPAQSLAAHDAEVKVAVLREVAEKFRKDEALNAEYYANMLDGNADRIEKEAGNG